MEKRMCSGYNPIGNNEDLLRNILIHVPNKPLFRFKSVSKLWLSVISDPNFSLRWTTKHAGSASALMIYRYYNYHYISVDGKNCNSFSPNFGFDSLPLFNHSRHRIEILQSCSGLLLVNLKLKLNNLKSYEVRIGVYNPRTNHSKLIPKFPHKYPSHTNCTKLAFDHLKSPHYKLVTVMVYAVSWYHNRNEILMYSSETDSWKTLSENGDPSLDIIRSSNLMFDAGVYLNGAIHWPCERGNIGSLYFDVDKECCTPMRMPPIKGGREKRTIRYFGESGGRLYLIDYKDDFTSQFDVFEMQKNRSKWFVKYSVDLSALGRGNIKRFTFLSLVVKNGGKFQGEEESAVLVIYVPIEKMVISYNLKNGESKKLCPLLLDYREMDNLKTENWLKVHHITY